MCIARNSTLEYEYGHCSTHNSNMTRPTHDEDDCTGTTTVTIIAPLPRARVQNCIFNADVRVTLCNNSVGCGHNSRTVGYITVADTTPTTCVAWRVEERVSHRIHCVCCTRLRTGLSLGLGLTRCQTTVVRVAVHSWRLRSGMNQRQRVEVFRPGHGFGLHSHAHALHERHGAWCRTPAGLAAFRGLCVVNAGAFLLASMVLRTTRVEGAGANVVGEESLVLRLLRSNAR